MVDDDPAVRLLLDLLIDPWLVVVGAAREGRVAGAGPTTLPGRKFICDIRMPVMDGLQALPLLRTRALRA